MLGVLAEGCMETLALRMDQMLPIIVRAAETPDPMVQRHGLLCLGYWCEFLGVKMAEYYSMLMPLAGKHLLSQHNKVSHCNIAELCLVVLMPSTHQCTFLFPLPFGFC